MIGIHDTTLWGAWGGGVVLYIMAYTGRLHPKEVTFSGFRYMMAGISLVEVYERVVKSVISVCGKI